MNPPDRTSSPCQQNTALSTDDKKNVNIRIGSYFNKAVVSYGSNGTIQYNLDRVKSPSQNTLIR